MKHVVALAENLTAVINLEFIDGRISWLPKYAKGWEPYNIYFMESDQSVLIIDSGVAAHADSVIDWLHQNLGSRQLIVFNSRGELECIGNIQKILDTFDDVQLTTASPLNPMDLIHREKVRYKHPAPVFLAFGDNFGAFGFPELRTVRPVIKTLGTAWLYDAPSKMLFTSDSFGADLLRTVGDEPVRTTLGERPPIHVLRDTMLAKFDWFALAKPEEFEKPWTAVLDTLDVELLAPNHGRIQKGREIVRAAIDDYREALLNAATV